MYWTKQQSRQENMMYIASWGILFAAPILSMYIRTIGDPVMTFDWSDVVMVWRQFSVFLFLFLAHNFLLAPLLVYRQRRTLYFSLTTAIVAAFTVYQCTTRPSMPANHRESPMEQAFSHKPTDVPDGAEGPEGQRPPRPSHLRHTPPPVIGEHDIVAVVILILMFGMNDGIKLMFKSRNDEKKLIALEKESLEQQLEYLKYQLNPHFLMNTLNNIHALVDIDPERSKEAIIQLSKILRYVLYESNHELVAMTKEIEFMDNYIHLMRMRYSDKLSFTINMPDEGLGIRIPPLLFISFVENAFKHGVSYQRPSFIEVTCQRYQGKRDDERLLWTCRNSKHPQPDGTAVPRQGGVGMANVRKRLQLIFGDNYSLTIHDSDLTYEVVLDIPLEV